MPGLPEVRIGIVGYGMLGYSSVWFGATTYGKLVSVLKIGQRFFAAGI